jgi:hypothetical protein
MILKLDFENAYDKISWSFLFEALKQRGCVKNGVIGSKRWFLVGL